MRRISLALYNLLFLPLLLLLLPGYLVRMFRRGGGFEKFGQRFGILDEETLKRIGRERIWIHATSVGEVGIALKFIQAFRERNTDTRFLLSVTTSTGMEIARPHVSDWLELIANPLDFPIRTGAFVRRIHPKALLMVEADLWPNRVEACRLMAIPTALINARLSVRSERRFSVIRRLVSPIFNSLDLITLTEPGDEPRWIALGVSGERLHLAGNIKYDTRQDETPGTPEWPVGLGWTDDDPVFLAASTHQGEEIELARAFAKMRSRFPRLRLVIAPRHAERRKEILQELGSLGLKCALRSQTVPPPDADLLILDSTGELKRWYCRATLVFVGKSLPSSVHRGGQNMIEPLQAGRPVLIGPCTSNFEPLATLLCDAGAAKRVHDDGTLEALLENLLGDPAKRAAMVEASGSVLAPHQSATIRNCRLVERLLER